MACTDYNSYYIEAHLRTVFVQPDDDLQAIIRSEERGYRSKRQLWNSLRWQIYIINYVDDTKIILNYFSYKGKFCHTVEFF